MLADEAKALLGFSPNCRPSPSQVKAAYRRKVWETHPDRFPAREKSNAECKFKMISEAYSCLCSEASCQAKSRKTNCPQNIGCSSGARVQSFQADSYSSYVLRTGVPRAHGGRRNHRLVGFPFIFIIVGAVALAGSNVARAYRKEKQSYPSHNPFLP